VRHRRINRLCIAAMIAISVASCQHIAPQQTGEQKCDGEPGFEVVKRPYDAIRIAWAMLIASSQTQKPIPEAEWAKSFVATLHGDRWEVVENPIPPHTYSTFMLKICASDGRFLGGELSD
jgi:hypothetical protein